MNINKILIVVKKTRYQLQKSELKIFDQPNNLEKSYKKIYTSHLRQLANKDFLKKNLKIPHVILNERKNLKNYISNEFDMVVSLGGDNHFVYVSHFCRKHLLLGCNSDPLTSTGSLLFFKVENLIKEIEQNWENSFIENWSLITGKVTYPDNSTIQLPDATSEITIRNKFPDNMSRFFLEYKTYSEEHRCSGILLYNGVGSTGWISSYKIKTQFSKKSEIFCSYSRELRNKTKGQKLEHFKIEKNKKFTVFSNIESAEICIDCMKEKVFRFPLGTKVEFQVSTRKQKILVKK